MVLNEQAFISIKITTNMKSGTRKKKKEVRGGLGSSH